MTVLKADQKPPLLISAVVAMATNRIIGDGTGLIWHLPDDLKRVKSLTTGCPLIMGRKTWQSIGRPLPGRGSIVLTRNLNWQAEGAVVVHDFKAAMVAAQAWITAHNPKCEKTLGTPKKNHNFWVSVGPLGAILAPSWGRLGPSWGDLGPS